VRIGTAADAVGAANVANAAGPGAGAGTRGVVTELARCGASTLQCMVEVHGARSASSGHLWC
jgi:hypothetical protein